MARLKLKLKRNWTDGNNQRQRYKTTFLKDTTKLEELKVTLFNKLQAHQELLEDEPIDEMRQGVKAVSSTCKEVLGTKQNIQQE